jgi:hypothetical protein
MVYHKPIHDYHEKDMLYYQAKQFGIPDNLKTYSWPSQLSMRSTHPDEKYPSCTDCGTMYASSYDLQRHVKNGCPMEENADDNDSMSEASDKYDDKGFTPLINAVREENQLQFLRKLDHLMDGNPKLSKAEARGEVTERMLPKDRNLLLKKYKIILLICAELNRS